MLIFWGYSHSYSESSDSGQDNIRGFPVGFHPWPRPGCSSLGFLVGFGVVSVFFLLVKAFKGLSYMEDPGTPVDNFSDLCRVLYERPHLFSKKASIRARFR